MEKAKYIYIRNSLNLKSRRNILPLYFLVNFLIFVSCIYLGAIFYNSWEVFLSIPLITVFMFRNFAMMHEAVHGVASKNKIINNFVGIITGGFCLLPFEPWKLVHIDHHYWSGNVEKDPVMALIDIFPKMPNWLRSALNFSWKFWIPTLAFLQHIVFWWHSIGYSLKRKKTFTLVVSLVWPFILWSSLFVFLPLRYNLAVLLPSVFLYLISAEVVNLPHHLELTQLRGNAKLPIWQQYKTARSCVYPYWLAKIITLNFNYHIEHHMFPDVPWYYLDKLHIKIKEELGGEYNTDPQFGWILKNRSQSLEKILGANNSKLNIKVS